MNHATHLKLVRESQGLTRYAAAKLAQVNIRVWYQWEQGQCPNPEHIGMLGAVLPVDVDYLLSCYQAGQARKGKKRVQ